jgi:HTH-type transcriptional regulator / antitoxin HigA
MIREIRPIKTETDYQMALREVEQLFDAGSNTPEGDRLDVLTTLIEVYEEQQQYSLPLPDPIEAIRYYMESRGLSERDLEPYIGTHQDVIAVLQRQRPLSIEMIRHLHSGLHLSAEVLIRPYPVMSKAA